MNDNWYEILGLDIFNPEEDENEIRKKIRDKEIYWKGNEHGSKGSYYKHYLVMLNDSVIEEEMFDEKRRSEMIEEAQKRYFEPIDKILSKINVDLTEEKISQIAQKTGREKKHVRERIKKFGKINKKKIFHSSSKFEAVKYDKEKYKKFCEIKKTKFQFLDIKNNLIILGMEDKNLYDFLESEDENKFNKKTLENILSNKIAKDEILDEIKNIREKLKRKTGYEETAKNRLFEIYENMIKNRKLEEYTRYLEELEEIKSKKYFEIEEILRNIKSAYEINDKNQYSEKQVNEFIEEIADKIGDVYDFERKEEKAIFYGYCEEQGITYEVINEELMSDKEMFERGKFYWEQEDYDESEKWYKMAADKGNANAMFNLAYDIYYNRTALINNILLPFRQRFEESYDIYDNFPLSKININLAKKWYEKAANLGNRAAMNNLGLIYSEEGNNEKAREWYEKVANLGDIVAMNNLGFIYDKEGNNEKAREWYKRSANLGERVAMNNLGKNYEDEGNIEEAKEWYEKAYNEGSKEAEKKLENLMSSEEIYKKGKFYYNQEDYEKSEKWYKMAAGKGNVDAMLSLAYYIYEISNKRDINLAKKWYEKAYNEGYEEAEEKLENLMNSEEIYKKGKFYFIQKDYEKSEKWYKMAADKGNVDAMFDLAYDIYEISNKRDINLAKKWYEKAANLGNIVAMNNLGVIYYKEGNNEKAKEWHKKSANLGASIAMNNLGRIYEREGNIDEAKEWYKKSANLGASIAMNNLGIIYEREGNIEEAKEWYEKVANLGNRVAMNNLGVIYYKEGNNEKAKEWHKKSANLGSSIAMNNLGIIYEREGNIEEAKEWYEKAYNEGSNEAEEKLENLLNSEEMYEKGRFYYDQKDYEKSEKWYKMAADKGNTKAMIFLGESYEKKRNAKKF